MMETPKLSPRKLCRAKSTASKSATCGRGRIELAGLRGASFTKERGGDAESAVLEKRIGRISEGATGNDRLSILLFVAHETVSDRKKKQETNRAKSNQLVRLEDYSIKSITSSINIFTNPLLHLIRSCHHQQSAPLPRPFPRRPFCPRRRSPHSNIQPKIRRPIPLRRFNVLLDHQRRIGSIDQGERRRVD